MSRVWRTLKGYFFWTYDRGSFHYDVMVTLILVFIFVTPRFINFKDQPPEQVQHPTRITVTSEGADLIYQVEASEVDAQDEGMVRANLARVIRPISGKVAISRIEAVRDASGHIVAYRAWVRR
jgi:hypothetical protein